MDNIIIVGTSSTARNVFLFINKYKLFNVIGFAVDEQYKTCSDFCDLPVFTLEEIDSIIDKEHDFLFVAIQWNNLNKDRRIVFERLKKQGFMFANLISPKAIINGLVIGENCWICDDVIIDFDSAIENDVFIKTGAYVADNVYIGAHCFIAAKALIAGGSKIGEQSFIGLSSTIFDDVTIGEKCIIGATTPVKRNLPDYTLVKVNTSDIILREFGSNIIEMKLQYKQNIR